ncbi:ParB/Srx family N-terminal domain-containing protein [Defluviimonas sp. SAOS-178_SWC]|uniref:ParB/Srx family N-terminal domain-containing protein n=1 Tax=Defluviimonas sp. SAOS-178_SWC TaxID=3121287 RepID=UPI0032219266
MSSTEQLAVAPASTPLAVTYRRPDDLHPDPRNARTHSKRQIEQIRASIAAFGFTNPILADPGGTIIAGHGRCLAAKAMGLVSVPVIVLAGLSEAQIRALRLADNKIALNAGWDLEILQMELAELAAIDVEIDATLTGFSTGDIDVILSGADDPDDEVIPAVRVTPRSKPGDIRILGDHRIGCGDGRDPAFLARVLGAEARVGRLPRSAHNVRISGHANAKGRHREFAMASGEMSKTAFRTFLSDTLGAAARVSRAGAVHFVCMDWRHMDDVSAVGREIYGDLLNLCIWNKSNAGMNVYVHGSDPALATNDFCETSADTAAGVLHFQTHSAEIVCCALPQPTIPAIAGCPKPRPPKGSWGSSSTCCKPQDPMVVAAHNGKTPYETLRETL